MSFLKTVLSPPPYNAAIVSSTPRRLVALLLAFLLAVSSVFIGVSILSTPAPACAAGTLLKDLPAGAPKQGVVVSKMDDFFYEQTRVLDR